MFKFFKYSMGVLLSCLSLSCQAMEKFEVLPDLPASLAYAVQPAAASTISGSSDPSAIMATQSIGQEPSIVSVVLSLAFVILLIYLTGILYTKLNKANLNTLKKSQSKFSRSQVSVVSTTQLGNNKTLHVVELDGKRMLIGASSSAIQLIKDLGSFNSEDSCEEFSHIEIPNIKIPKIEIPKIEIPTISFSKLATKTHKKVVLEEENLNITKENIEAHDDISENKIENSEGIINSLFATDEIADVPAEENCAKEHVVDPDDFALYKKYL